MNVLLVEDNDADRRAVKEAFVPFCAEMTLHMVEDGQKALDFVFRTGEYAEAPVPSLVLLDLNLPGTPGREVLRQMKSHPETRNIPIIVLTSSDFQKDVCEAYELHANCYINKPMRYSELQNLLKLICDFWVKEVRYCFK